MLELLSVIDLDIGYRSYESGMIAIVTDVKYRMATAIIRDLGAAGVRVIVCQREDADNSPPLGFFSKYASVRAILPNDGYADALYDLCQKTAESEGGRPALLPVGAATLALLAEPDANERFSGVCGLCIPTAEQLALLNDKGRVAELAKSHGVSIPESYSPEDGEHPDTFFARVPLPCVVKPRWGEGLGLTAALRYVIAYNTEELRQNFMRFSELAGEAPIVQEYLPGASSGCSVLAQRGEIVRKICHRRVREYPVTGGPSTCCDAIFAPHLEETAAILAGGVGLNGLAMFEFKDDKDGAPRLLEVNPRVWGSYPLTRISKSDFTYAWFALSWNAGNPDKPVNCPAEKEYKPRRMVFFPSDIAAARDYLRVGKTGPACGAVVDLLRPRVKDGLFEWRDARPALRYWRSLLSRSSPVKD